MFASRNLILPCLLTTLLVAVGGTPTAAAEQRPATSSAARTVGTADWKQVSAGGFHTCGIRTSGRLYCWGSDGAGQLGNGGANTTNQPTPVEVAGGATNWSTVSAGGSHTCARRTNGRLYCWGSDVDGQVGDGGGTSTSRPRPVEVAGGATNWASVSAGTGHTCARRTTGRLYCWGYDGTGGLGDGGANTSRARPVEVAGGATNWASVSAGYSHTCAVRTTGRLFCWGWDGFGQLGNGGTNATRTTPGEVAGGATSWVAVAAGDRHTCATRTDSRLYCWGFDSNGQLGDGPGDTSHDTPQFAGGATGWTAVTAGDSYACGRRNTGQIHCWGFDSAGQLGDGLGSMNRFSPADVGILTDWSAVDAGGIHSCGRRTTGQIYCWGSDFFGQLGDGGTNTDQDEPVEVAA